MAAALAAGTAGGSSQHTHQPDTGTRVWTPQEQEDALAALRVPFEPEQISQRPVITCTLCDAAETGVCRWHTAEDCEACGERITTAHGHLDYVGHAHMTDRLLEVDPLWSMEPLATDERGMPLFDGGSLWVRLTVAGISRIGIGDARNRTTLNPWARKEALSDALRNAGMRFGMALNLWAKDTNLKKRPPELPPAEQILVRVREPRMWNSERGLAVTAHAPGAIGLRSDLFRLVRLMPAAVGGDITHLVRLPQRCPHRPVDQADDDGAPACGGVLLAAREERTIRCAQCRAKVPMHRWLELGITLGTVPHRAAGLGPTGARVA